MPPGSISDYFWELFGSHFGAKNDQRTTAGQFSEKKARASPYCKNYMIFKILGGPTEKKNDIGPTFGL